MEKTRNTVLSAFLTSFIGLTSELDLGIRVEDGDRDDDVSTDGHSIASGLCLVWAEPIPLMFVFSLG